MGLSKQKRVKIFGVPIDLGSEPLGVEMGPEAIRHAGLHQALEYNNIEYLDYGNLEVDRENTHNGSVQQISALSEHLAELVCGAIQDGYIPMILGGDHSAAIGSIAGTSKTSERLGLLWLDCHPDANTPKTSPSGNIHGMTVAISLGYGYPQLVNCAKFKPKVLPQDICILGAKDIDKSEQDFIKAMGINMFTLFDIEKYGIVQVFDEAIKIISKHTDRIHVSFDVDVLDPVIAPGTGITSRGGLTYREISYLMEMLGRLDIVGALDIIEINPLLDFRNQTSELVVELALSVLGGCYGDYHRTYLSHNVPNHKIQSPGPPQ